MCCCLHLICAARSFLLFALRPPARPSFTVFAARKPPPHRIRYGVLGPCSLCERNEMLSLNVQDDRIVLRTFVPIPTQHTTSGLGREDGVLLTNTRSIAQEVMVSLTGTGGIVNAEGDPLRNSLSGVQYHFLLFLPSLSPYALNYK
uniref:Secreted peptide n=1 Tax=Anopheles braziliensis TaxID=58242 RepID=A0A2M3ZLC1_9DIPT